MTLDLSDVGQTSNGEPEEFALQSSSDRLPDRGLSNTRRTNETDDLPFHGSAKLSDSQELQNSVLYILQSVMVLVQDLMGVGDRVVFFGMLSPRDLGGGKNMEGVYSFIRG